MIVMIVIIVITTKVSIMLGKVRLLGYTTALGFYPKRIGVEFTLFCFMLGRGFGGTILSTRLQRTLYLRLCPRSCESTSVGLLVPTRLPCLSLFFVSWHPTSSLVKFGCGCGCVFAVWLFFANWFVTIDVSRGKGFPQVPDRGRRKSMIVVHCWFVYLSHTQNGEVAPRASIVAWGRTTD